ncbi:SDR family NAD(P)-dependent oxidoreductase [Sphingomonas immobilis]|uniref:SDR family oxidoreductase n=1 Tax=Sphingomonas immobilis TaxID=3063997 RepID=A0ABT9A2I1_9SPHN|nr:SDR family oxidoreductase [Sphingomonas sp. CA1-15]MDO7844044.1 SDR family oxidoreductase [Sphingomonas sp. CA1-15]
MDFSPLGAFSPTLLAGKVALVTGSTAGIGARTAEQLASAGATVILNGRSAESGHAMRAELEASVPTARFDFVSADYNRPEELDAMFAHIRETHGGLDIVCHTTMTDGAGPRPFMETARSDWLAAVSGIYLSLLEITQRAVPMMIDRGGGAIVSFASDAAKVATPGEAVLGGALAANCMFVRAAGLELARHKIRLNAVTPSITRGTKTYDKVMANPFSRRLFEKAEKRARLGVASAEHVAPMAVFLASPLASHITGQVVSVNGGISAA